MTKEEKIKKIESLRKQATEIKKEVDYYNALQLALKLVLNGSYFLPPILKKIGGKVKEHLQQATSYYIITT
jgi:hypothetical protein